jgi:uncharacterized cupredoxin-like copper-binding protein
MTGERASSPSEHARDRSVRTTVLVVGAVIVALGVAVLIGVLAHGSGGSGSVAVTETEYRITMPTTLHAGRHTFSVKNIGTEPHELVIVRTDLAPGSLPRAGAKVNEASSLLHVVAASAGTLQPGTTRSMTVNLPAGRYVVICDLPSHYGLGMRVGLSVSN